jgi:hypothetical protein
MQQYRNNVQDRRGNAIAGATVQVLQNETPVTVYDAEGQAATELTTDANGEFVFSAPTGNYTVRLSGPITQDLAATIVDPDDFLNVTPEGEAEALTLGRVPWSVAQGPRDAVIYVSSSSFRIYRKFAVMGGFRFRGQYTKGRMPAFALSGNVANITAAGLGAQSAVATENWYAAFACANNGSASAVIKTMPFLRVGSIAGSVVTLNKAGEGIHTVQAKTYSWNSTNNLAGVECLVIGENGNWSGRVATITANTATTVTLDSVGSLAFGDFLLPAPPGYTYFCYLGSAYYDTAEVRNIYDSGVDVGSKGITLQSPNIASGSIASTQLNFSGYISPLATAVVLDSTFTLSTTSAGDIAEYYDPDGGNHVVQTKYLYKVSTTSQTVVFDRVVVPFIYPGKFFYSTGGGLAAQRVGGQLAVTGWIEP